MIGALPQFLKKNSCNEQCLYIYTHTRRGYNMYQWLLSLHVYMPHLTLFLLCFEPDPKFVSMVNCIKENIMTNATGFLFEFVEY